MNVTKNWFAFKRNIFKLLAKIILISLGLTTAASVTNAAIEKEDLWIKCNNINNFKQRNLRYEKS